MDPQISNISGRLFFGEYHVPLAGDDVFDNDLDGEMEGAIN